MKKILIAATFLFQILVITSMFVRAHQIKLDSLRHGTIARLDCTAYDPFNPFKGRYVKLTIDKEKLKSEEERLGLDLSRLSKNCTDYYMQEDYADFIDKMNWSDFNDLKPVLEVYVDKKGRAIQKALLVHQEGKEISIEEYVQNQK